MKKNIFRCLLSFFALYAFSWSEAEELRWGADAEGGAPYVFHDPADPNKLIGFEVEIVDALAKKLRFYSIRGGIEVSS